MRTFEAQFILMAILQMSSSRGAVFGCTAFFHLTFSILTEMTIEIALPACDNSNTDIYSDRKLSDVVQLSEDPATSQVSLDYLDANICMFSMPFGRSKYKPLL